MDLLSLVLTLRPTQTAPLPPRLGRAAHAIFLAHIAARDAALAEALHAGEGPRPFTCSELIGARRGERLVAPEQTYTLRYTALAADVAAVLAAAFAPGDALTFEGVTFTVETLETGTGANDDPPESKIQNPKSKISSPWAACDDYQSLAARHLLPAGPAPENAWTLLFASPTAFKTQGQTQPLPLPGLVFGSLARRWNAFAPVALPEEGVQRYAEEMVVVSRFGLRSAPGWDRGHGEQRGLRIGCIGKATYRAQNRDRYWLAVFELLAEFARYAGVGAQTVMGMGQTRRVSG